MIVTGNLWLNHSKSIDWFNRKVDNRDEMNDIIVKRLLDKRVFEEGKIPLWILGCLGVGNNLPEVVKPLTDAFNVFLVPAATDDISKIKKIPGITVMPQIYRMKTDKVISMCAYPMLEWPGKQTGALHYYGTPTTVDIEGAECFAIDKELGWYV